MLLYIEILPINKVLMCLWDYTFYLTTVLCELQPISEKDC